MKKEKNNSRFAITSGRGFHVRFDNGYTLSTQFGGGNYCNNYNDEIGRPEKDTKSPNAEIAIIDNEGEWATEQAHLEITGEKLDDAVKGWVGVSEWKKYLDWTGEQK